MDTDDEEHGAENLHEDDNTEGFQYQSHYLRKQQRKLRKQQQQQQHLLSPKQRPVVATVPRGDFYRLAFPSDIEIKNKINWIKTHLNRHSTCMSIPHKNQWWVNYIYVKRSEKNLIEKLIKGDFSNVKFVSRDIPPSKQHHVRYNEFICKGIPPEENIDMLRDLLENEHIYSLRRIKYNGQNSASVKLVWKSSDNPPTEVPLYDSDTMFIKIYEMKKSEPICYNCQELGHISTYCKNIPVCRNCSGTHKLSDCNNRVKNNNLAEPSPQLKCNKCGAMDDAAICKCNTEKPGCSNYPPHSDSISNVLREIRKVAAQQERVLAEVNDANNKRDQEINMLRDEIKELKTQIALSESSTESLMKTEKEEIKEVVNEASNKVLHHLDRVAQYVGQQATFFFHNDHKKGQMAIQNMLQQQGEVIATLKVLQENMQNQLKPAAKSTKHCAKCCDETNREVTMENTDSHSKLYTESTDLVQAAEVTNIIGSSENTLLPSPATKPASIRLKRYPNGPR